MFSRSTAMDLKINHFTSPRSRRFKSMCWMPTFSRSSKLHLVRSKSLSELFHKLFGGRCVSDDQDNSVYGEFRLTKKKPVPATMSRIPNYAGGVTLEYLLNQESMDDCWIPESYDSRFHEFVLNEYNKANVNKMDCLGESETNKRDINISDSRLLLTEKLLKSEKKYFQTIESTFDVYAEPLGKCTSFTPDDHDTLFMPMDPIISISRMLCTKLEEAVNYWDSESFCISHFFSKEFWNEYEEYQESYRYCRDLVLMKRETDHEFSEFLLQKRHLGKPSLETLLHLPIQRLPEYDHYLNGLLADTPINHLDFKNLEWTAAKAREIVKENILEENEYKIDKIQDLFPFDQLLLCDKDYNSKLHSNRRKSAPGLLMKPRSNKRKSSLGLPNIEVSYTPDGSNNEPKKNNKTCDRSYIMEAPVQLTTGLQNQDRYLFLFNDMLVISKVRSNSCHKLKSKVRLCEMWISTCISDVCEANKSHESSFVIGWPATNVVVTFSTPQLKELWMRKLKELISQEKNKEKPVTIPLNINICDPEGFDCTKMLEINHYDTAEDVIRTTLDHLDFMLNDPEDYQLWVKMGKDDSFYPLIGHEQPYSIKMKLIRDIVQGDESSIPLDISHLANPDCLVTDKCKFTLKNSKKKSNIQDSNKKAKKRKSPIITWSFKRLANRPENLDPIPISPTGKLFALSLSQLSPNDAIPKPIMDMLHRLFHVGLFTSGIFRKSANARICRELRDKLDTDFDYDFHKVPVIIIASILKDFLRSLPDSILSSEFFDEWLEIAHLVNEEEKICKTKKILEKLPRANILLLKHLMCLLWHIHERSNQNNMPASNLGICFAPTLIWPSYGSASLAVQSEASKKIPHLVQFLIENCQNIFEENVLKLLGDPSEAISRHDSGEESDSNHSLCGVHCNIRRDDSSIDSLERDVFLGDCDSSPKLMVKGLQSPNNLSRDSGLMMSDTQLYSPDEDSENKNFNNELPHFNHHSLERSFSSSYCSSPHLDKNSHTKKMNFLEKADNSVYCAKVAFVKPTGDCSNSDSYKSLNKSISMEVLQSYNCKRSNFDNTENQEFLDFVVETPKDLKGSGPKMSQSLSLEEESLSWNNKEIGSLKNCSIRESCQIRPKLQRQAATEINCDKNDQECLPPKRPPRYKRRAPSPPGFKKDKVGVTVQESNVQRTLQLNTSFTELKFSSGETSSSASPETNQRIKCHKGETSSNSLPDKQSNCVVHNFDHNDSFLNVCDVTEDIFSNPSYHNMSERKGRKFHNACSNYENITTTREIIKKVIENEFIDNLSEIKNEKERRSSQDSQYQCRTSISIPESSHKSEINDIAILRKKKTKVPIQSATDNKSVECYKNKFNDNPSPEDSQNSSCSEWRRPLPTYTEAINRKNILENTDSPILYNELSRWQPHVNNKKKLRCRDSLIKYKHDRLKLNNETEESPPPLPPKPKKYSQQSKNECFYSKKVISPPCFELDSSDNHLQTVCDDSLPVNQNNVDQIKIITDKLENSVFIENNAQFDETKDDSKLSVAQLRALFSSGEPSSYKHLPALPRKSHPDLLDNLNENKIELHVKKRNETLRKLIKSLPGESYV